LLKFSATFSHSFAVPCELNATAAPPPTQLRVLPDPKHSTGRYGLPLTEHTNRDRQTNREIERQTDRESRDGKVPEPSNNEPNQNSGFAKNRNKPESQKIVQEPEPNRTH